MKRGKKMLLIILSILGVIGLVSWGVISYLGRGQTLTVKSIENPSGDLYLIRLEKPNNVTWKAGAYAQFTLTEEKETEKSANDTVSGATKNADKSDSKSHWLTIASNPDENEILILTRNTGSLYKKNLTSLAAGSKVEMSWLGSHLQVADGKAPLVCFASDVGIAAIRPLVKEWAGQRAIFLIHLDKGVTVFDKEMAELAHQQNTFLYETSASLSQSQEHLKHAVAQYGNKGTYLLAGQPDDVEEMKKFLTGKGIERKQITSEVFRGLK